jgi:3-hydroxyisobutyrate dehydrogenase
MSSIAFLGAGTMGGPMVRNLAAADFSVRLWNRSPERARALIGERVTVCETPQEAADGCDILITMLSDAPAVVDSAGAALDKLAADGTWIQMSTIGLEGTQLCIELAQRGAVEFIDAPVLGTREPAERGELVILAAGGADALRKCQPVFDALGSRTLNVGEAGHGTAAKLVCNNWTVGLTTVLGETLALAQELGLDQHVFLDAIQGGALDLPYAHIKGEMMIEGDYSDASFKLRLALKDAGLALAAGEQHALDLSVLRAVWERLERAENAGHGDEDMAAVRQAVGANRVLAGSRLHGGEK